MKSFLSFTIDLASHGIPWTGAGWASRCHPGRGAILSPRSWHHTTDDERATLALAFPDAIIMSAKNPADVTALRARIVEQFAGASIDAELFVPWARHKLVHEIYGRCQVVAEIHEDDGTRLTVHAPSGIVAELQAELATN